MLVRCLVGLKAHNGRSRWKIHNIAAPVFSESNAHQGQAERFAHCSLKPPIEPEVSTQTITARAAVHRNLYVPPDVRSLFTPRLTVQAIGEQLFFHQPTVNSYSSSVIPSVASSGGRRRKYHRFVADHQPAQEPSPVRAHGAEGFHLRIVARY